MLGDTVANRVCSCLGCPREVSPGKPHYPFCSGRCRAKDYDLRVREVRVKPVRAGERISTEAGGGGVIERPALVDGILVERGEEPAVFVPKTTIVAALAILDRTPRKANGHGR